MQCQDLRVGEAGAIDALPDTSQCLLAKISGHRQPQLVAQLRVVAEFGMRIQRQMVGKEIDVVRQQQGHALLHPAPDAAILAAPEQTVVDQDRIGPGIDRGFDQGPAGGDARDETPQRRLALDLQTVGSVVLEALGLEQAVKGLEKLLSAGHGGVGALEAAIVGHAGPLRIAPPEETVAGQQRRRPSHP